MVRGTINSPSLAPWVSKPLLCQPFWWLVLSLFLIVFLFLCCFPKSHLLTFHSGRPWAADLQSLLFQGFLPFQTHLLAVLLTIIFPKWAESIPARLKVFAATSLYSSSLWVPWGTNLLFMNCHSPCFLVFCCTTGCLRRTYLRFLYFMVPILSCLNPTLAVLHVPRIMSLW